MDNWRNVLLVLELVLEVINTIQLLQSAALCTECARFLPSTWKVADERLESPRLVGEGFAVCASGN
jgi:hypothetical protein